MALGFVELNIPDILHNLPKTIISIPSRINEYTSNNLCAEDCKGNKNRSILDGRKF